MHVQIAQVPYFVCFKRYRKALKIYFHSLKDVNMEINLIGAVHYQGHSAIQVQITVVAIVINQELRIQANQVYYL